ncbi:cofactor-independent phosphoglycerate mutase [Candidatus Bathyarchaeota archaeon]|nr:cofactor-independent phosphoglycerate mutase [Candidatus Bathyarchaeota archaeon]
MKYILLVNDGMADYQLPELNNKTPMQVADTPNLNEITPKSKCGRLITVPPGSEPGSDAANLSILGYDPKIHFTGRGPLEAAAQGIKLDNNDIAFRCNLITEKNGILVDYSAGHISTLEAKQLIDKLNEKLGTENQRFYPGLSYRNLLILKNTSFSERILTTPPHNINGRSISENLVKPIGSEGVKTADFLNRMIFKSKEILENHPINLKRLKNNENPANMIWPWSGGRKPQMQTFEEKYHMSSAVISAVDLIKGIGIYAGMDVINVPGATGLYDTNYEGKADYAIESLKTHDFVFVHVEAPDEAGHAGEIELKIKTIENFDKRLLGRILKTLRTDDFRIAILPDHPTPIKVRTHTSDPVPFLIYDPSENGDGVKKFDEFSVEDGSLGTVQGADLLQLLFSKR